MFAIFTNSCLPPRFPLVRDLLCLWHAPWLLLNLEIQREQRKHVYSICIERDYRNFDDRFCRMEKTTFLYLFFLAKQKIVSEKQSYVLITNPLKLSREFISCPTKIPSHIYMEQTIRNGCFDENGSVPQLWRLDVTKKWEILQVSHFSHV